MNLVINNKTEEQKSNNSTEERHTTVNGTAPSISRGNGTSEYDTDDVNERIRKKKENQDAKMGTDAIGSKQKQEADDITKSKKDMAAGPGNEYKDQPPQGLASSKGYDLKPVKEKVPEAIQQPKK